METAAAPKVTNRFAVISLIAVIVAFVLAVLAFLGGLIGLQIDYSGFGGFILNLVEFLLPIAAVVSGVVALRQIKLRAEKGKVWAVIGIILGGLIFAIQVLFYAMIVLGLY